MKTILLLFIAPYLVAQEKFVFNDMEVKTIYADTVEVQQSKVLVSIYQDKICFEMYLTKCLLVVGSRAMDDTKVYLLTDSRGDRYVFRIEAAPDGIIMWLSNAEKNGYPHFVIQNRKR